MAQGKAVRVSVLLIVDDISTCDLIVVIYVIDVVVAGGEIRRSA